MHVCGIVQTCELIKLLLLFQQVVHTHKPPCIMLHSNVRQYIRTYTRQNL